MENKSSIFKKAVKNQSKMRTAIQGIAGAGKSMTAQEIAKGLTGGKSGKIAVIDTEHGSMSKYADRYDFDVVEMSKPYTIEKYCNYMIEAEKAGYEVIIIDSMTHAWQELLTEVDKIANAKYKGNSFRAWSEGTPKQRMFIDAILSSKCHIIATMRVKTEYVVSNNNGKTEINRAGLSSDQGKNIEYEFDMLMEMTAEHTARFLKDRTGKFQDQIIEKPDYKLGEQLLEWLNDGEVDRSHEIFAELTGKLDIVQNADDLELVRNEITAKKHTLKTGQIEKLSNQFKVIQAKINVMAPAQNSNSEVA